MVFQVVSGAVNGPDHGSDRALEVGDRDRSLKDADKVVVPGLFSLSTDQVYGSRWGGEDGSDVLAGAVLYRGEARAV